MYTENKLYGKTVLFNGDSICAGTAKFGSWATRLKAKNALPICQNYAVGGGIVSEGLSYSDGKPRHSVSASLDRMHEEYPNADYIILEGGTNDADLHSHIEDRDLRGSFDPDDYSGNYDRATFAGALESVFYRATKYWRGKKICYIVAHKMSSGKPFKNRRSYFDLAIEICKKWGIPYLDLWNTCYLNSSLPWMYDPALDAEGNDAAGYFYADSQHLTSHGYDLTADIIDSFLKTL